MTKIDDFKSFVKKNPKLVKYVKDGESSWQKFYEIYDLYGESDDAWKEYLGVATVAAAVPDLMSWFKSLNLDTIQNSIGSIQRVLGVIGDFSGKDGTKQEEYKPRPIYKHFDD